MRIWIINHYAMPPSEPGGTRHFNFTQELIRRGHEVFLIASNYNHFSSNYFNFSNEITSVPFILIPVPSYKKNSLSRLWNMFVFSFRLYFQKYLPKQKPDVIIGSSPHLFAAWASYLLAKQFRIPFVLEVRDIWPQSLVDLGKFSEKHPLIYILKKLEMKLYHSADHIISLLPGMKNYLTQYKIDTNKVSWIPNTVDFSQIGSYLPLPKKMNEPFVFMYAGAHGLANDLETLIEAAKILKNKNLTHIKIFLIGEGPEKNKLHSIAYGNQLTNIEFFDALPKAQVYQFLQKADAFILLLKKSPIFQWGISPNKLFDYLALGRPVIFAVDTPYNPIIEHRAGITVPPSDPEKLANAFEQLAHLTFNERKKMGENARDYALTHHHIQVLGDRLEEIIFSVTKGTPHFRRYPKACPRDPEGIR